MTIGECLVKCRDGVAAGGACPCGYVQRQVAMPEGVWSGMESYAKAIGRTVGDVLADLVAVAFAEGSDLDDVAHWLTCGDLDCPVDDDEDGLPAGGSGHEA